MKLHRLTINGYKNLNDLKISFAKAGQAVVLVGQNGSGKSNLIEALAIIFRDLADRTDTDFSYQIEYSVGSRAVRISNNGSQARRKFWLGHSGFKAMERISEDGFYTGQSLIPSNIFGYYSGAREHLPAIFEKSERQHLLGLLGYEQSLGHDKHENESKATPHTVLRSPFYGRLETAPLALFSLLADQDQGFDQFLKSELGITGFDGALLTLKSPTKPEWSPTQNLRRPITWELLGGLDGEAAGLINDIWSAALLPFSTQVEPDDIRLPGDRQYSENLTYLYIPDTDRLRRLVDFGSPPRGAPEIFAILENLQRLGFLVEAKVWVRRNGTRTEISSSDFSDGERQLLTICGLLRLTPEEETLFLLDEPDTHLNPGWKWDFLKTILEQTGDCSRSQLVLTTHDPLTLASLTREQVFVVYRDHETREAEVDHPPVDPKGLGVAGVLRQVFGMRSTLDPETQKLIEERNRLLADRERDTAKELQLLALNEQIRRLGLSIQNQQDMFEQFLKALDRREYENRMLTPAEIVEQNEAIEKALEKLGKGLKQ